jgi:hypothetical protein
MSRDGIQLLLAALLGEREVVSFRPALARVLGPIPALFLCQACFWQGVKGAGEWWYKLRNADRAPSGNMLPPSSGDRQSWEWELGLSRSDQEGARRILRQHGLLEEELRGVPAQLHYRVDLDRLAEFLLKIQQIAESDQLDGRIRPARRQDSTSKVVEIQPANTYTTPSITTTTTHQPVVEIDNLIEAAVWAAQGIRSPSGFRAKVRARILASGPTPEDIDTLSRWSARRVAAEQQAAAAKQLAVADIATLDPIAQANGAQMLPPAMRAIAQKTTHHQEATS